MSVLSALKFCVQNDLNLQKDDIREYCYRYMH